MGRRPTKVKTGRVALTRGVCARGATHATRRHRRMAVRRRQGRSGLGEARTGMRRRRRASPAFQTTGNCDERPARRRWAAADGELRREPIRERGEAG